MNQPTRSSASFRDPSGVVTEVDGRILRILNEAGLPDLEAALASATWQEWAATGRAVASRRLAATEWTSLASPSDAGCWRDAAAVVEHERLPFVSYPYEWPPEMLHAAGRLTIDLALALLPEGLGLKDATPYNVLFRGPNPVFVDLGSVERRAAGDPVWMAQAQFVRTFALPLLAAGRLGLPLSALLLAYRDGLQPEDVCRWAGRWRRLWPPFLGLASLPAALNRQAESRAGSLYEPRRLSDDGQARFVVGAALRGARRALDRLAPTGGRHSVWSAYQTDRPSYTADAWAAKESFITEALARCGAQQVLDLGCNTGHWSAQAARAGAQVVAVDSDEAAVGATWRQAQADRLDVLPLVVDIARPTPAVGWYNREQRSFLDRARQSSDLVLMLALVHHLLVTERIPLSQVLDLAADLTRQWLLIEYVDPADAHFQKLLRGRGHLFAWLTRERFEAECCRHFELVAQRPLAGGQRQLYLLARRAAP